MLAGMAMNRQEGWKLPWVISLVLGHGEYFPFPILGSWGVWIRTGQALNRSSPLPLRIGKGILLTKRGKGRSD